MYDELIPEIFQKNTLSGTAKVSGAYREYGVLLGLPIASDYFLLLRPCLLLVF